MTTTIPAIIRDTQMPTLCWRLSQYICQIANTHRIPVKHQVDLMACLAQAVEAFTVAPTRFEDARTDAERARRAYTSIAGARQLLAELGGPMNIDPLWHDVGWLAEFEFHRTIQDVLDFQAANGEYLDVLYVGTLGRLPIGRASLWNKLMTCTDVRHEHGRIIFGTRNSDGAFVGYVAIDVPAQTI